MNKYKVSWFNGVEWQRQEEMYISNNKEELESYLEENLGSKASKQYEDEPKFKIDLLEENIKIPLKL